MWLSRHKSSIWLFLLSCFALPTYGAFFLVFFLIIPYPKRQCSIRTHFPRALFPLHLGNRFNLSHGHRSHSKWLGVFIHAVCRALFPLLPASPHKIALCLLVSMAVHNKLLPVYANSIAWHSPHMIITQTPLHTIIQHNFCSLPSARWTWLCLLMFCLNCTYIECFSTAHVQ